MTQFLSVKENIRKAQMKFSYVQTFKFRRYQMLISRYCFSHIKKKKKEIRYLKLETYPLLLVYGSSKILKHLKAADRSFLWELAEAENCI